MLQLLAALARSLRSITEQRIASRQGASSSDGTHDYYHENVHSSTIPWNNLMAGYGGAG